MVVSEAVDPDGNPVSKTYSLLQKGEKKPAEDLDDFNLVDNSPTTKPDNKLV